MTYQEISEYPEVIAYNRKAEKIRKAAGEPDISGEHLMIVADGASGILRLTGESEERAELAGIAGYLSEIGVVLSRTEVKKYSALLAETLLKGMDFGIAERLEVISAIAHSGDANKSCTDPLAAAVILADRTDVRRNRVREKPQTQFTDEDRICFAVIGSNLKYDRDKKQFVLELEIDEEFCSQENFLQLFLPRLLDCRRAAGAINSRFSIRLNGRNPL